MKEDLSYVNCLFQFIINYDKVKSNTLYNNFTRKIYNSIIIYYHSILLLYIHSNHSKKLLSYRNFIFLPRTSRTYSNQLHSSSQKALSILLPHIFQKELEQTSSSPTTLLHQYLFRYRQLSPLPPIFVLINLLLLELNFKNFPPIVKKFERNLDRKLGEPASIRYPMRRGENRWSVAMAFTVFRPQGPPVARTHYETSRSIVPAAGIYHRNPLHNTFHRDNPQLLPPSPRI